ncbi:MAG TPA: cupin domain-containing protein [Vitreimonas sp.]|nr:cupin domain-containing protein [Vitreimonas sp.]
MFSKKNIQDIPIEETPHATGSRKLLVSKDETLSIYFEAFTYGYLPASEKWTMHKHANIVEICVVIKGEGVIRDAFGKEEVYQSGDRFIFPADTEHEIENKSDDVSEFYFIRFQNK